MKRNTLVVESSVGCLLTRVRSNVNVLNYLTWVDKAI